MFFLSPILFSSLNLNSFLSFFVVSRSNPFVYSQRFLQLFSLISHFLFSFLSSDHPLSLLSSFLISGLPSPSPHSKDMEESPPWKPSPHHFTFPSFILPPMILHQGRNKSRIGCIFYRSCFPLSSQPSLRPSISLPPISPSLFSIPPPSHDLPSK